MQEHRFIERKPRDSVSWSAELVRKDGSTCFVMLTDFSSDGFRLKVDDTPMTGEIIGLHIPGYEPLEGQIRWALGNAAGGKFRRSIKVR